MQSVIGRFVATELLNEPDRIIPPDDDLLTGGLVDSMGIMTLVFFLEQEFGVQIAPGDVTIENFGSLQQIEQFVTRLRL
jgi:acyl carrier protein